MAAIAQVTGSARIEQPHEAPLRVRISTAPHDIEAAQRLRHRVFARECGAQVTGAELGLDRDDFDDFCEHVLIEHCASGELVGTTRLLDSEHAALAGRFYSQTEFAMEDILSVCGNLLEVGRTCIHPGFRGGAALALLWQTIGTLLASRRIDALIGCASIPLGAPGTAAAVVRHVQQRALTPPGLRVVPLRPLPRTPAGTDGPFAAPVPRTPPLLLAYLRMGARVCGDAFWDADFGVADVLVLLERDAVNPRYGRHFIGRAA